jgi:nucleotide-binding universal stress UspA family protein
MSPSVKARFFRRILAATGRPEAVDPPLITATRLARRQKARLYIVHAITSAGIRRDARWPLQNATSSAYKPVPSFPILARHLVSLYGKDFPQLTMEDIRIVSGVAWEAIFRNACELESHLIVVGPHYESRAAMQLPQAKGPLGSTAEGVLRHARCPVMMINRSFPSEQLKMKNIVVGVDFSPSCISALCITALISVHFNSQVHPFHMLPIPPYPKYSPESLDFDLQRTQAWFDRLCEQLLQGTEYENRIKTGVVPHTALLRHARNRQADLIVMGTHTKEKAGKWYPGSVVQQVSSRADCPVLVVSGPEALAPWKDDPLAKKLCGSKIPPLTLSPK